MDFPRGIDGRMHNVTSTLLSWWSFVTAPTNNSDRHAAIGSPAWLLTDSCCFSRDQWPWNPEPACRCLPCSEAHVGKTDQTTKTGRKMPLVSQLLEFPSLTPECRSHWESPAQAPARDHHVSKPCQHYQLSCSWVLNHRWHMADAILSHRVLMWLRHNNR